MKVDMKDIGLMMFKMDLGLKSGMMEVHLKVIIKMGKKKDMGNINGLMEVYIEEIGKIIKYREKVYIFMQMGKNILENIKII